MVKKEKKLKILQHPDFNYLLTENYNFQDINTQLLQEEYIYIYINLHKYPKIDPYSESTSTN